ncbi:MAG: type I pullulanase, partial [Clostridium sp.]|nr:type I pullulanase [Clostridium sp.]
MKVKKLLATILTVALTSTVFSVPLQQLNLIEASAASYEAYNGNDLGATYSPTQTTFKVWAPTASKVQIKRYTTGSDSEAGASVIETKDMTKGGQNVWSITISGDLKNTYYTYLVDGRETPDVYGRTTGINGDRSMVIDLDSTDPAGWENDQRVDSPNQTDAITWEVHVKDFSYDSSSGISAEHRGKFLAFTEEGTTLNGDGITKTGIDYLKELGVTHVQILPMYDYASVDERNPGGETFNWGYDPKNYNVPEGSYSTNPYDGNVRVSELKQMVKALHDAGIGVVMDVVYNHTYAPFGQGGSQNEFQKAQYSPLDRTVPGYYYTSTDWSGCGNSTDSTKEMYRKYMIDSIVYWATEYHLDGFRFDLMGIHDVETMNQIRAALNKVDPQIKMWGEPWCGDGSKNSMSGYANKANCKSLDNNIAMFSDNARDAIKGNTWDGKLSNAGWVTGNGNRQTEVIAGIKAQCGDYSNINQNIWSKQPSQVITYTSCHDNHALYDILCMTMGKSQNGNRYDDIVAMNKLSASIVLTSQGSSFFQAGEEFARSKMGDHNSYQSSASINKLDWKRVKEYSDLVNYYKGLIEIRKNFSAFRDPTTSAGNRIQWLSTPGTQQIAYSLTNNVSGEWSKIVCLFNASTNGATINLPSGNWVIVANSTKAGVESLGTASGSVQLPGRSAMILVEKNSFDNTVIGKKGTVIVNHVNQNGDVIKTETKTGKEGTSYTTSPMNDEDYILVSTPSNANGKFTAGTITVTYQYKEDDTPRGTVTVKYVDKETGNEIATSESLRGKVGKTYTTTAKTIKGYELIETPSNATGTYTEGNKVVTYYYKEKEIKCLTVHYYNTSWSTVNIYAYDESSGTAKLFTGAWPGTKMTNDGNGWWSYEVTEAESGQIIFNNGSSQEPSGVGSSGYNATGEVWVKDGKVLTEDPNGPSEGTVIVKYVDEAGNEIATSTSQKGTVGTSYTTTAKTISNYDLITIPNNATGKFTASTITVTYVYAEVGFDEAIVKVKYVDEAGNEIASSTTKCGFIGDSYTTTPKTISGYELVSTPSNASGKFTKEEITVTYKYKKSQEVENPGYVKVKYVDVDTNEEIADSITLKGEVGTSYSTTQKTISGYTFDSVVGKTSGTYKDGTLIVTYRYRKSSGTVISINSFTSNKVSPQVKGTSITLTAKATGEGTLQYRFRVGDGKGNYSTIKNYSTSNTTIWNANYIGSKVLYLDVRDGNGQVTTKTMNYVISDKIVAPTISSFTANKTSPQVKGTAITLTAKATGAGTLQYRFRVGDGKGNYSTIKNYSTSSTAVWNANYTGNKVLYLDVRDSNGQVTTKTMNYVISDKIVAPTISSFTANKTSPQVKGTAIILTAKATGAGTLQYRFRVGDGKGNYSTIQNYSESNVTVWNANYLGSKILCVDVKDSNGKETTKTMNYVISDKIVAPTISSFTTNKTSPQVKGTTITLTAKATGTGTLQYRFRVGDGKGNYSTIKNYSTTNTATWNANYVGTKVL